MHTFNKTKNIRIYYIAILFVLFFIFNFDYASAMSSGNYSIVTDSINFSGGDGSSINYSISSTLGQISSGTSTGTIRSLNAGYQQVSSSSPISSSTPTPSPSISPIVSSPIINFGTGNKKLELSLIDLIYDSEKNINDKVIDINFQKTDPLKDINIISDVSLIIKDLKLSDFTFIQNNKNIELVDSTFYIDGNSNLTIRLPYNKVPEILKTIAITLTDPIDNNKVFPFVL